MTRLIASANGGAAASPAAGPLVRCITGAPPRHGRWPGRGSAPAGAGSRSIGVWMSFSPTSRSAGCIGLVLHSGLERCVSDLRLLPRAIRGIARCGFPAADVMRGIVEPAAELLRPASTSSPWRIRSKRAHLSGSRARVLRAQPPQHAKISGGDTKKVLKEAWPTSARGGRASAQAGFSRTASAWLAGPFRSGPKSVSSPGKPASSTSSTSATSSTSGAGTAREADQSFDLWCLINLFSWYEHWFA